MRLQTRHICFKVVLRESEPCFQNSLSTNFTYKNTKEDKKAFLSDQCKETEENNKMGKTRDFFKKIRDTKGTFHAKNGLNKGQKWYGTNRTRRY